VGFAEVVYPLNSTTTTMTTMAKLSTPTTTTAMMMVMMMMMMMMMIMMIPVFASCQRQTRISGVVSLDVSGRAEEESEAVEGQGVGVGVREEGVDVVGRFSDKAGLNSLKG
jgi:hypothetical protein